MDMQNTILVIDDDDSNRLTLDRLLSREGFAVRQAANGREGSAAAPQPAGNRILALVVGTVDAADLLAACTTRLQTLSKRDQQPSCRPYG